MTANGKTVLLVEDNEDNRIVYSTILRHFGYSVTEALNGEEGIAKARSEHPDLILMDISIPVIDGWEATQVLKHDPQTREIPIIALTAHALASDRRAFHAVVNTRHMTANGKTVLLVEDNEDNRIVYSTLLRHFGYSVTE